MLRYSKLSDVEILSRLYEILAKEKVKSYDDSGMKAILFTCNGDMRNAVNTLETTYHGFQTITEEKVMKVVDEPHPMIIKRMIDACGKNDLTKALSELYVLWNKGFACEDIIGQIGRVIRMNQDLGEDKQLKFMDQVALTHYRIASGSNQSILQLSGLISTLCSS